MVLRLLFLPLYLLSQDRLTRLPLRNRRSPVEQWVGGVLRHQSGNLGLGSAYLVGGAPEFLNGFQLFLESGKPFPSGFVQGIDTCYLVLLVSKIGNVDG
jgi:hypothetical protein